ncbi:MAG: hypothetical protein DMG65_16870 [Candidatus Angelobacter sp. Gp1-AA117]|nr:MAG: hypothetical protein DMG65_16870 [Candidatus Angelobacter sp. Gp1-AA117]
MDEPPFGYALYPLCRAKGSSQDFGLKHQSGGLSPVRGREASCTPELSIALPQRSGQMHVHCVDGLLQSIPELV